MNDININGRGGVSTIPIAGREWLIRHAANLDEVWDSLDEREMADERLPYWVEVWPAAIALVEWLSCRSGEIVGRRCLDLGCGLGLTAIAGQFFGGSVLAVDYEEAALECARDNASLNGVRLAGLLAMDWRAPAVAEGAFARIWASDIVYEKRFISPLIGLFGHLLAADGKVWISDPGRNIFPFFMERLPASGLSAELVRVIDMEQECAARVRANIWEIRRS